MFGDVKSIVVIVDSFVFTRIGSRSVFGLSLVRMILEDIVSLGLVSCGL